MSKSTSNKMIEIDRPPLRERAVLVHLALPGVSEIEIDESIQEMRQLASTAGADVECVIVQHRKTRSPGTFIGKGKIEEVRLACEELDAGFVLIDGDLTPKQGTKLENMLDRKVVDRTQIILDIFALHAHTNEGKHQVELAQLEYILPRLAGRGSIMRQQGGIGVRGPGEQKLEIDRRVIRNRIHLLKGELEKIRVHRRIRRKRRLEGVVGTVALVGYTNAGKSSLLNAITNSDVLVEDKLFATLDPRTRSCTLPSEREIVITDTVGFIRNLPHTLINAFMATLEEVNDADLLLLVADASHPAVEQHIQTVHDVLEEIKVSGKTPVTVFNKIDLIDPAEVHGPQKRAARSLLVSAKTGEGIPELLATVDEHIASARRRVRLRIPQSEARLAARVHESGRVFHEEYEGDEIILDAEIDVALQSQLAEYVS